MEPKKKQQDTIKENMNTITIKVGDSFIVGGEVQKVGKKLAWKMVGIKGDKPARRFFSKDRNIVVVGDTEIRLNHPISAKGKAVFLNRGIISAQKDQSIFVIEILPKIKKRKRYLSLQPDINRKKIANTLSDIYKEEGEEINVFAKSIENLSNSKFYKAE